MIGTDADDARQAGLADALCAAGRFPHRRERVERVETHISRVLLVGAFAYKLKKPVDLGFADFSTLERRRTLCWEELRLNRRLAPGLYLGVVSITGPASRPCIDGDGPVLDYAVQMRRFPQAALLSRLPLDADLIDAIADQVARFHDGLPPAAADAPWGRPEAVLAPMRENFAQIRAAVSAPGPRVLSARLARWTELSFTRLVPLLEARRRGGCIRECHGDLHRGNIAVIDGAPVIFDCIEFNPSLRWIDTISELGFLFMDLHEAGEGALAWRCLNRYLEQRGDHGGLPLLRFYAVYRAMVRAKVMAIRLTQARSAPDEEQERTWIELRRYLRLARQLALRHAPRLLITCGLSGSGKTWLGRALAERLPAIHLRSDVERKRLFGRAPAARSAAPALAFIYGAEATRRTYARLAELARMVLEAGCGVLVDATFLKQAQRDRFAQLAAELDCPMTILVLDAPDAVLRQRIQQRLAAGTDASEAGLAVLEQQMAARERLTTRERARALFLDSSAPLELEQIAGAIAERR